MSSTDESRKVSEIQKILILFEATKASTKCNFQRVREFKNHLESCDKMR